MGYIKNVIEILGDNYVVDYYDGTMDDSYIVIEDILSIVEVRELSKRGHLISGVEPMDDQHLKVWITPIEEVNDGLTTEEPTEKLFECGECGFFQEIDPVEYVGCIECGAVECHRV